MCNRRLYRVLHSSERICDDASLGLVLPTDTGLHEHEKNNKRPEVNDNILIDDLLNSDNFEQRFDGLDVIDKPEVLADFLAQTLNRMYLISNGSISQDELDRTIDVCRRLITDIDFGLGQQEIADS